MTPETAAFSVEQQLITAFGTIFRWRVLCHRVDDIEDNSKLRRGVPVAHSIYGVPSTINTANYVYFQVRDTKTLRFILDAIFVFVGNSERLNTGSP